MVVLGERFGTQFRFDVASPNRLIRGTVPLGVEALEMNLGVAEDFHIVPVIAGAASGLGKIIAGVALIAIALAAPYVLPAAITGITGFTAVTGVALSVGVSLTLLGVGQLMAKSPQQDPNGNNSFLFGGQLNTSAQGGPVPLVYGRFLVGSVIISAGLDIRQLLGSTFNGVPV